MLWKQNAEHTAITDPEIIATKNMHAKSQRIAVNVSKNKHDVNSKSKKIVASLFLERDATEKFDKKTQYTGNVNAHHLPGQQNLSIHYTPADHHQPRHQPHHSPPGIDGGTHDGVRQD